MKIIDNRYKIERKIADNFHSEIYLVSDLWGYERKKVMKLYNYDEHKRIIDYFIDNFIQLSNIKYKNLLSSERFNIVKYIDTKKINMLLYYSVSEYIKAPKLNDIVENLSFNDRLRILLDIIVTIDYLHFRGYVYQILSPSEIYVLDDKSIKLTDLITIAEKREKFYIDDFNKYFLSPEILIDKDFNDKRSDYYSIGVIMKYLLLKDFLVDDVSKFSYIYENISEEQRELLNNIILKLTRRDFISRDANLIELADKINEAFDLGYTYDLVSSRNTLFFNNKIVGREKEIEEILKIDSNITTGNYKYKGIIINGEFGVGKTRLLNEMCHQLKMRGRDVYYIQLELDKSNDLSDLANILKQSLKDTPAELMEKYRGELSKILPELRLYANEEMETDLSLNWELFRLFNRISNYFSELSRGNTIYLVIDDLQYANLNLITMIDYLLKNIKSNNMFFIFSYDKNATVDEFSINNKIEEWVVNNYLNSLELSRLTSEEVGLMVQNILGISYVPNNLAGVLYKESHGNPRYIEYLIKHLYATGELYMNPVGSWYLKVDSYSDLYFPSDINEAIEKQLNLIRDNYFDVFKILSIFDGPLYKKILLKMIDIDEQEVERQLEQLKTLGIIDEKLGNYGYYYNIKSIEIKRMIYNRISEEERIRLHNRASEILIDLEKDNEDIALEELLYHLIKSHQTNRAINIILEKYNQIDNKYSPQSRFLLEKAYNIVGKESSTIKLEILEKLVDIYFIKGELEKSRTYLNEYKKVAQDLNDFNHVIKSKMFLVDLYFLRVELEKALKEIEEIELISEKYCIPKGNIIALISRARMHIENGNFNDAEKYLQKAVELSKIHNIDDYLGTIYNRLGIIRYLNGNMEEAIKYYDKSIKYCQQTGNMAEATKPINNIGGIYLDYFENPIKAMEYFEKGKEIATNIGILPVEIVFLNNISEIYIDNYEFEKALEYLKEVKKAALDLQDINMLLLANINLGKIYLSITQFDKAFECVRFLNDIFSSNQITYVEILSQYYDFLGNFYGILGDWDKAIEYSKLACDTCKDFNRRAYLVSKSRIIVYEILKNNSFKKDEIEKIRQLYANKNVSVYRRRFLLQFAILSAAFNEFEYAMNILEEDSNLMKDLPIEYLDRINEGLLAYIEANEKSIKELINREEKQLKKGAYLERFYLLMAIGYRLIDLGQYKQSLKYLFEALNIVYKIVQKIPSKELKFSFIKSNNIDDLKRKIVIAIKEVFGYDIKYISIDEVNYENLDVYFDISILINLIGVDEFINITQFDYYDEAVKINTVEELISKFVDDCNYNLDLILKYLSKITFANKGYILGYDEQNRNFYPIVSLDNSSEYEINERFLNLAASSVNGILINKNYTDFYASSYMEFLKEDVKGIICVPIFSFNKMQGIENERRKKTWNKYDITGFVYLETDNVFNRFDYERLKIIKSLSYLVFVNLENNKLRLMATTDKLTNVLTRKYFEKVFDEIIDFSKSTNRQFSVLMLDIDRFKRVNDIYGHRKGDEVLSIIGNTIKSTIRSTDVVGRYGGEEFLVILKDTSEEDAYKVAEKIRKKIEKLDIKGLDSPVTVSIGISMFPHHSSFRDDLVEKADQALYYAKELGRNKVFIWNSEMKNTLNRVDKLAGIVTGDLDSDNRNVLALIDVIELIKDDCNIETKTFEFLGRVLEAIDGEYGTVMFVENDIVVKRLTRGRFSKSWVNTHHINENKISNAIKSKIGEFFVDWENIMNVDPISGLPNWQSVIVLPLIKNNIVKGVLYITTSLRKKEFDFNSFNLAKYLANIFAALL